MAAAPGHRSIARTARRCPARAPAPHPGRRHPGRRRCGRRRLRRAPRIPGGA